MIKYIFLLIVILLNSNSRADNVSLAWDPSSDTSTSGYNIYYGGYSKTYTNRIDAGNSTSIIVSNLLRGVKYYFAATAYNFLGLESDLSNEITYTPGTSANSSITNTDITISFSFNEGNGSIINDISTNKLIGNISGASWTNTGKYGNALNFNGVNSYVDLGNPNILKLTNSMTLEAWVKPTANPPDDGQIICKSSSSPLGFQFKTSPDTGARTFAISVATSSTVNSQRYSQTIYMLNTWYHVAGVFNAAAGTLDIYVNGVLNNGILRGAAIPNAQFDAPLNVLIGKRADGYLFAGIIDEVRICNRALSQAEIQNDMNTPIGNTVSNSPPNAPINIKIIRN